MHIFLNICSLLCIVLNHELGFCFSLQTRIKNHILIIFSMTNPYHAQPFDHLCSSFNTLDAANLRSTRLRICSCLCM
ncbi:hypothetical protein Hanom_Chr14g01302341 [Helianthus anomalus]